MTQPTSPICPHLGLTGDRTVVRTVPDSGHRCYAQTPPRSPDLGHQGGFCLGPGHSACPFYIVPRPDETTPPPARRRTEAGRARRAGLWALLALVLVAMIAVYAWDALRTPDPAPQPAQGAVATGAAAKPIATPAPSSAALAPGQTKNQEAKAALSAAATPKPGDRIMELLPKAGAAGWWTGSEARGNHLGDSYLYAGYFEGHPFVSAILFDLSSVPRGAPIHEAALRLTGLQADRFDAGAGGTWSVQLLSPDAFKDLTDDPSRAGFQQIFNAPAAATLFPTLYPADLGQNRVNELSLDASGREWLAQQIVDGVPYVIARIVGPTGGNDSLFAWDSGAGPATGGEAPKLTLSLGAAPPTPPPLPTEVVIVITLTLAPDDVLAAAARVQTATASAELIGTPTLPPYRLVTATPIPANMATAQALGFTQGLPAIVVSTSVPANAATATYQARYATAVAVTTGTFTPVPTDAVTPVIVLPTPMPENIVTAAAQMRTATAQATRGTMTPLPFNAVMATLTPTPYIYEDTPTPENAATAQARSVYATAVAVTTGTFTPLPPGAVRITRTPLPTPIPLVLYLDRLAPGARPTPTPTAPSVVPRELVGKILFVSDRDGEPKLFAVDPGTGRLAYVTQSWPFALAQAQESLSPDGFARIAVANDGRDNPQLYVHDTRYQGARQLTNTAAWSYDPAWSPRGDRIAYVSQETGNDEIYLIGLDGSNVQRLTENSWEWDKHPSWSPDGSQIVFWSNRETGRRQLWIMNADGSNQRRLLDTAGNDWDPVWVK